MSIWNLLRNPRRRREQELDEEIQSHLAMAVRERMERGENRREAEIAATREFGNVALTRETTRAMWGSGWPEQIHQDLRYACRNMRMKPGVTAVIIVSLALGIGANVALFSVACPVLLRPLPVADPDGLVELLQKYPGEPRGNGYWTSGSYQFYKDHNHVFSALTATTIDNVTQIEVTPSDHAVVVGESVAGNYFSLLGIHPLRGRLIAPEDSGTSVAVLSWNLWRSRFREDPTVLGKRVIVNNVPAVVIGIAPPEYTGLLANAQTEVWTPANPKDDGLNLIGRLKPGASLEQARNEMKVLYRFTIEERLATSTDPQVKNLQIELESARSGMAGLRDRVGQPLTMLLALVAVLLLLACVNIAGIVLAQAAARDREMALRSGLGASRGRLIRQVLTESCFLSAGGTLFGVVIAYLGTATLLKILDSGRLHERVRLLVNVDSTVVLFTAGLALITGVLIGVAPAVHLVRRESSSFLRQAGRAVQSRSQRFFGRMLVSTQVALAILLLSFGALFTTNLANLKGKDLGFRRDHVLLATVEVGRSGYRGERLTGAMHEIASKVNSIPGVLSASLGAPTPLMGAGASGWASAEGFQEQPEDRRRISISWVAPQYFKALQIPILAGRDFNSGDEAASRVAIISEGTARYYFGGHNALGKRIMLDKVTMTKDPATYEIVGVVGNANYREIRETDQRLVYLPAFGPGRVTARTLVIRTAVQPESVAGELRRVVQKIAPALSLSRVGTLSAQIDASIVPERMVATLSGFFAVVGGLLAGIGLYGLLAYTVTKRTNEIGVRVALGATSARILRMVLGEAVAVAAAGVAAGVPLALWSRAVAAQLVQDVSTAPAMAIAAGVSILLTVAAIAAAIPARRATQVDAMQCLRHE
jgi:predicted permease